MVGILNTFCLFQGDTGIRKFNSENKIKILKLIQAYHVETFDNLKKTLVLLKLSVNSIIIHQLFGYM